MKLYNHLPNYILLVLYIITGSLSNFKAIDILAPQWIFLGAVNILACLYFLFFNNSSVQVGLSKLFKSIFIYTGKKENLINYFELCRNDLIIAEKSRKIKIFINLIKFFMPNFILKIIRKIRNKKIDY